MIEKVAVGTDGSETADKAVDFAFDVAEKFGATVVICSSYRPVSEDKVRATSAKRRRTSSGRSTPPRRSTRRSRQGRRAGARAAASRPSPRPARATRPTCSCDIAEAHGADLLVVGNKGMQRRVLGQRPEQRLPQGALLGGDRQDDVTCRRDARHGRPAEGLLRRPQPARHRRHDGGARRTTRSGSSTRTCRRPAATAAATRSAHFLEQFLDSWDDFEQQIEEVHAEDGLRAAVHPRSPRSGAGSGIDVESRYAHLWVMREGRGVRVDAYYDRESALAALRAAHQRLSPARPTEQHRGRERHVERALAGVEVLAEDRRREQLQRAERRVGVGGAAEALDPVVDRGEGGGGARSRSGRRPRRARSAA